MSRILVVDDERIVRELVAQLLAAEGHEVVTAVSGDEAYAAVTGDDEFALVLSDLSMPGLSGAQLVETLRAERPGLPVLVMSGTAVDGVPFDLPPGALGLLGKPFTAAELVAAVRSAVEPEGAVRRLVIAEDHAAVRASLVAYFSAQDDFEVVGAAENGREAVDLVERLGPDIVLMDVRMPLLDGIEATRLIKEASPQTRVVLLSAYEQDDLVQAGERAGADGFLLKGVPGTEIVAAIRELAF